MCRSRHSCSCRLGAVVRCDVGEGDARGGVAYVHVATPAQAAQAIEALQHSVVSDTTCSGCTVPCSLCETCLCAALLGTSVGAIWKQA